MLLAWLPIALLEHSLWALGLGLVTIDLGLQALHVSSQTLLYALDPQARSRLVAAYMLFYSLGSAAGAIASTATTPPPAGSASAPSAPASASARSSSGDGLRTVTRFRRANRRRDTPVGCTQIRP